MTTSPEPAEGLRLADGPMPEAQCRALLEEYRRAQTSERRRHVIRETLRQANRQLARALVGRLCRQSGREAPGSSDLEELTESALDGVFGVPEKRKHGRARPEPRLEAAAGSFDAAAGAARHYLENQLEWAARDVLRIYWAGPRVDSLHEALPGASTNAPRIREEVLSGTLAAAAGEPGVTDEDVEARLASARDAMRALLEVIREATFSLREQALVFLHPKAYLEPEARLIPLPVLRVIRGGLARLRADYETVAILLEECRTKYFAAAHALEEADAKWNSALRALQARSAFSKADFEELRDLALVSTLEELEEEEQALDPLKQERWALEVACLVALRRKLNAQAPYLNASDPLRRFVEYEKPWVRSQPELAELLGAPQGTIGREQKQVRDGLRPKRGALLALLHAWETAPE